MNQAHLEFLASPMWAKMLEDELLPWLLQAADLGDDVLEIGPGPGLTTDILRSRVPHVTAIEFDADLAAALARRLNGTNVDVVHGDGTDTGFDDGRFSAVTCFSMLHHVASPDLQNRVLAEAYRVLRPGGRFIGVDSLDREFIRVFHEGDVFVPTDPDTLEERLRLSGFDDVRIETTDFEVRFVAR
jgi:SAM-dependent methyltransferase